MYRGPLAVLVMLMSAIPVLAESQTSEHVYVTYRTVDVGAIDLVFDTDAFTAQGWGIIKDTLSLPLATTEGDAIEVVAYNGDMIRIQGSPRAIGSIELSGPEEVSRNVTGFVLPLSGRGDAALMDSAHPVFAVPGDSLVVDITGSTLTVTGDIVFHAAASELGIDANVGHVGYFQITAPVDVVDIDHAIDPVRETEPTGDAQVSQLPGADVIVGSLPTIQHWTTAGPVEGKRAYSVATTSCNIGTQALDWFVGPNSRHPVIAQNLYRYKDGRLMQLGQSWLKHGFCALQQSICSPPNCQAVCGQCCQQLGVGCSDPYSASRNGQFSNLGPRSEINPHMGTNLGTHAFASGDVSLRGRIIVENDDLDPESNSGASYFVEGHYVAQDDAQFGDLTNDNNNASYRRVTVNPTSFSLLGSGETFRQLSAINAWKAEDAGVELVNVDIPGEGRLILGYRVTDNGDGTWHYEYAIQNLNSDRAAGSLSIPTYAASEISNAGFYDVDYHSGEPYDGTDWAISTCSENVTWSTQTFAENQNANALRWGTMYNFWFDANSPPTSGLLRIEIFKPGGTPTVPVDALVPSELDCPEPALVNGSPCQSFSDRAFDGYIDPRMESSNGTDLDLGLSSLTVEFNTPMEDSDGSPLSAAAFAVSDTGGSAPRVTSISTEDNRVVTVNLSGPISVGEWTTLSVSARSDCSEAALNVELQVGFLPDDVDGNGSVQPLDLLRMRQALTGIVAAPAEGTLEDHFDIDRNGTIQPLDLLRWRQQWFGQGNATQSWEGADIAAP